MTAGSRPDPFAPDRTSARRLALVEALVADHDGTALVVGDPLDVRYLTGFTGSNAVLLVDPDGDPVLATDGRYVAGGAGAPGVAVAAGRRPGAAGGVRAAAAGPSRPDRRGRRSTAAQWVRIAAEHPAARLVRSPVGGVAAAQGRRRGRRHRRGSASSPRPCCGRPGPGRAGLHRAAARATRWSTRFGGEGPAFDAIVAAGPSTAPSPTTSPPTGRPARRPAQDRLRRPGRRLPRRHDPHVRRRRRAGGLAGRDPRARPLGPAGRARRGLVPGAASPRSMPRPAASSRHAGLGEHFGHGLGHGVGLADPRGADPGLRRHRYTGRRHGRSPSSPGSTCPAAAGCGSRTPSSSVPAGRSLTTATAACTSSVVRCDLTGETHRGHDQRPEERPGPQHRRPAVDRRRVPARQARQGRRLRAHQAEERAVRQGRRPTFNAGVKVETANVDKRDDAVPVPRRRRLRLHGHLHLRPDPRARRRPWATPRTTCWRTRTPSSRCTTAPRCTSSCPASVELEITYTEPGLQGDRSTGGTKPATLETGAEIPVPLFIEQGERVKVDTRDGSYLGRVELTVAARSKAASGPWTSSSRPTCAAGRRWTCSPTCRRGAPRRGCRRSTPTPPSSSRASWPTSSDIDELLGTYAIGWTLDRMPAVDRDVLRIGAYEVLFSDDGPRRGRHRRGRGARQGAVHRRVAAVRQRPAGAAHGAAGHAVNGPRRARCPGWDSNPHWTVFETASSAGWDTGARPKGSGRGRLR